MKEPQKLVSVLWLVLLNLYSVFLLGQSFSNEVPWKLVSSEDGMEVFTQTSEDSPIKAVRISYNVKASLECVQNFLAEVPQYTDWVYKCVTATNIKSVSQNEFYYYIALDFPFPMSNRDIAIHSNHFIDSLGSYHSYSKAYVDSNYFDNNNVHINEFESNWNITTTGDDAVKIDYYAFSNPSGDIPVWLINLAIAEGPKQTMNKFKEIIEKHCE